MWQNGRQSCAPGVALSPNTLTAFFSYSREDLEFALCLAKDLKKAGASVWMDKLDIRGGQRWATAVEDALTLCPCVLVILSPSSVSSTNVLDEVTFALEEKKAVIPVFYKDCRFPCSYDLFSVSISGPIILKGLRIFLTHWA